MSRWTPCKRRLPPFPRQHHFRKHGPKAYYGQK
jgi:hypothetical protein